jgi:hypothetical protein
MRSRRIWLPYMANASPLWVRRITDVVYCDARPAWDLPQSN